MFGALKRGFRSMAGLILVRNVVGELQPKRTLAASRGFLAAARLSCFSKDAGLEVLWFCPCCFSCVLGVLLRGDQNGLNWNRDFRGSKGRAKKLSGSLSLAITARLHI